MRRISSWEKLPGTNEVRGKALQDLGYDCFAVYCTVFVYEVPGGGWNAVIERTHFPTHTLTAETRFYAMMASESYIAGRWSSSGILRWIAENPNAFGKGQERPAPIPVTDCKKYPFWKPRPVKGPQPQPAYMSLLTPEIIEIALLPSGASGELEDAIHEDIQALRQKSPKRDVEQICREVIAWHSNVERAAKALEEAEDGDE